MKMYKCTVKGKGYFPVDMLRYDQCWPTNEDDVMNIVTTFCPNLTQDDLERSYEVSVCTFGGFNKRRWRSFGWIIIDSEEINCEQF